MEPWEKGMKMTGVSISAEDKKAGSPKEGDMIAENVDDPKDRWLVSKEFFEKNYTEAVIEKTLGNTNVNGAKKNVKDLVVFGDGDKFKLLSKASSQSEGWMKSTKVMSIPKVGCVVQVTTQQKNPDGSYSLAEDLTFVPGVKFIDGDIVKI